MMRTVAICCAVALAIAGSATAQVAHEGTVGTRGPKNPGGTSAPGQPNTTGDDRNVAVAPGAHESSSVQTGAAAGDRPGEPRRVIPPGPPSGASAR
jgi:hypothetical protein